MHVNSQGALNSWVSSRARQLTKDHQNLGACSPRETHMKEPTSTIRFFSYLLLVGMPISPSAGKQALQALGTLSKATTPRQGTNTLFKAETPRQAKCKNLVEFPLAGLCSSSLFSLSHASWAACTSKGSPKHRASRSSYFLRPHAPPALWSPDSHIPKRRWCSAKRGS